MCLNLVILQRFIPTHLFCSILESQVEILELQSSDFESFSLSGEVSNLEYPLYDKDAKKLSRYFLEGVIDKKGIRINSRNKKFLFVKDGNISKIILDGYNLRIDEVFSSNNSYPCGA